MARKWCSHCGNMVETQLFGGSLTCAECGKVLEDIHFSEEAVFVKDGAGQCHLAGNYVRTVEGEYPASRERTIYNAKEDMKNMCYGLGMDEPEGIVKPAAAFYQMALEKNFTRGRRSELVQAACLYIACRERRLPYLLIDFSNMLKINVYVLGAVFLQLCKALWLEEHHIVQKPIDPSLFIHKYTTCLSGGRNNEVARTALRIIANMRMDWMQTGRKPSGLWGAAVYVSALAHGLQCSKSDVLRLVHVCEATLTKRLVEFENTKSGSLTIEELNDNARAAEKASAMERNIEVDISNPRELLCEHKGTETPHYKIGLCKSCYNEFVEFSGGLEGGSDPPAFQRAERERAIFAALEKEKASNMSEKEMNSLPGVEQEKILPETGKTVPSNCALGHLDGPDAGDDPDTLSDIDDFEVDSYLLHNEEEKNYKKIIWEQMNREYLEEQAAKEAAVAAAKAAVAANFKGTPEELQAAQELAAATQAALTKARKEKQQKRAADAKNATPAQTAAEATRQMLEKKRLSKKINYDILDKLFDETGEPESAKKQKTESHNNDEDMPHKGGEDDDGLEPELGEENDGMDEYAGDEYEDNIYHGNGDEEYDYEDERPDLAYDGF